MSDEPVHIRQAGPSDLETVVAFNQAMAVETEGRDLDSETVTAGVRQALADPGRSVYFLAEIDGEIAGQTMFTTEWSDWRNGYFWWIQSVFIAPEHRRKGVFRALHQHIRALAKARPDVCGLRLYVHHDNQRAMNTYRQLGMTQAEYHLYEEEWATDPPAAAHPD